MRVRGLFGAGLLLWSLAGGVGAEELTREKRADIEQLLTMTGALSLGKQMASAVVTEMTGALKKSRPDIPKAALDLLPGEIMAVIDENMAALKEAMIPIYDKYYTDAELKQLIQFYSSDIGQKSIKVMPNLMQEGMSAGRHWGEALGPQIQQRVTEKLREQGIKI